MCIRDRRGGAGAEDAGPPEPADAGKRGTLRDQTMSEGNPSASAGGGASRGARGGGIRTRGSHERPSGHDDDYGIATPPRREPERGTRRRRIETNPGPPRGGGTRAEDEQGVRERATVWVVGRKRATSAMSDPNSDGTKTRTTLSSVKTAVTRRSVNDSRWREERRARVPRRGPGGGMRGGGSDRTRGVTLRE